MVLKNTITKIPMSNISKLKTKPHAFRRLTGITVEEFEKLLTQLKPRYEQWNRRRLTKRERQRAVGAGMKHKLLLEERLLMLLMYYRTYVTHVFLSMLFGLADSNVGRNINPLQPLLAGIFKIPEKKIELSEDEIAELFFDATEQRTNRPKYGQKEWYSGKKHAHTIKHQVVVVRKRKKRGRGKHKRRLRIVAVSKAVQGRIHDKTLYGQCETIKPPNIPSVGDLGYLGTDLIIPIKKKRKIPLTKRQKQHNKNLASRRIVIEHGIGKMKVWKILSHQYRNARRKHTLIFKNIAGLHNVMFA